jgi:AmiR/NasT family two-component response regulator
MAVSAPPPISALLCFDAVPPCPDVAGDLRAAGIHVLGAPPASLLVREALRLDPDVVVCHEVLASDALLKAIGDLAAQSPRPVVVFTDDPDADRAEKGTRAGAHAWVVQGYSARRLRSVIHVARARFRHLRAMTDELSELTHRFEERKLVERAKGILMRARQMSEDDAYRTLRTVSMRANQRLALVSEQVIAAAKYASGVNSAGQLRMLSQRAVTLYALMIADIEAEASNERLASTVARIDGNLEALARGLSTATFGDLLEAVIEPWAALKPALAAAPSRQRLLEIDALAEMLVERAETLTSTLESAGLAPTLRVINVSGRQRMLSQRRAKQALVAHLAPGRRTQERGVAETERAFDEALAYLNSIPLTDGAIRAALVTAAQQWQRLCDGASRVDKREGALELAATSEALLETLEQLTDRYERSMQTLMGAPPASSQTE